MTDHDHNRSNDTGTGAKALDRDDAGVQEAQDRAGIAGEPQPTESDSDQGSGDQSASSTER